MTKAIVTYAAGMHQNLLDIALPRFREYADKHGYKLIIGDKLCDRPGGWNKIPLLIDAFVFGKHEHVLWLDCDLVITDTSMDVMSVVDGFKRGMCHSLVRHFTSASEVPNSGVWLLRKDALPLLERIWELTVFTNHGWWEQAALMTLLGYSVPPEGSVFDRTKCRVVHASEWHARCHFLRCEWNSHPNYRADKPRIVHCSYPDMAMRIETMQKLVEDAEYDYPAWPKEAKEEL